MGNKWDLKRLKGAKLSTVKAKYRPEPSDPFQMKIKHDHPELFSAFNALSIGDEHGQAVIIPLDESSIEVAELIIKAIEAYNRVYTVKDLDSFLQSLDVSKIKEIPF